MLPSIEERREHLTLVVEDAMRPPSEALIALPDEPVLEIARRIQERQAQVAQDAKPGDKPALATAAPVPGGKAEAKPRVPVLCSVKRGDWRLLDSDHIMRLASHFAPPDPAARDSSGGHSPAGPGTPTQRAGSQSAEVGPMAGQAHGAEEDVSALIPEVTAANVDYRGPLPLIFPDESLEEVLRWAGDWPVLAVVNRTDLGQLEGILALADILRAFREAATA